MRFFLSWVNPSRFAERLQAGHVRSWMLFATLCILALGFTTYNLYAEMASAPQADNQFLPYALLMLALLAALSFEFVNGFHDTANAVATVIYTHALTPNQAVAWSGLFNFLGVLFSTGAVAFAIVALLPLDLILKVGSAAGFAMVFALLLSAMIWNLGTWWLGLPASSSHTMIGSILGIGLVNAWQNHHGLSSGVDWSQASKVFESLLISPLIGLICAAMLMLLLKTLVKREDLFRSPQGEQPPPWWIRLVLITTCTGVSFAHGSNDGQKGMGLIMLILVGTVPTAFALNKTLSGSEVRQFIHTTQVTQQRLVEYIAPVAEPRAVLMHYVETRQLHTQVLPAMIAMTGDVGSAIQGYGSLSNVPRESVRNIRNDMFLVSEVIADVLRNPEIKLSLLQRETLAELKAELDKATKFIPLWVKLAVAIALALGTMIGWKRIVVTIGEKIGKSHLNYAQGASAELVTMVTIAASDGYGLPVSTTHVLSSGVAGTMLANHTGVQMQTVRNLIWAWLLTLPMAIVMAGGFYFLFLQLI